jgi:WYL_2, Sm-like SH3 beta-barrel fold
MVDFTAEEHKEEIWNKLNDGTIQVIFTKKDGTERIMNCTLHEDYVPEIKGTKAINPDVIAVYDVDAEGWRSFRWDSIKKVNYGVTYEQ